ncbi:MAG: hypothetical protein HKM95_13935 [Inquilinus sp.]|nr:hypothetical protein [Inquilinus sp.]
MQKRTENKTTGNSGLTAAIVERSQGLARRVSRVVDEVRRCHLDDAFLSTDKGMCYRDDLRDHG